MSQSLACATNRGNKKVLNTCASMRGNTKMHPTVLMGKSSTSEFGEHNSSV